MKRIARNVLLGVNAIAVLLSIVILALALWVMYGGSGVAELDGLPLQVYYGVIAFNLFVFLIGILGIIGGCMQSKAATVIFVILNLATVVAQIVIMTLLLLYANGVSTTSVVDEGLRALQLQFQDSLLQKALEYPEEWAVTQTGFDCCGIDMNATYQYAAHDFTLVNFTDALQPGEACADSRTKILQIHAQHPTYSEDAETQASELEINFCKAAISSFMTTNTMYIGIIVGFLVLVQIITSAAAIRLLVKTTVSDGGFQPDPDQKAGALTFNNGEPQSSQVHGGVSYA